MSPKEELNHLVEGNIVDNPKTLAKYSRDASIFEIRPTLVIYPKNAEDIKKLVVFASTHKGVTLTPRGGGTDMTGGPLSASAVLDMTRHFNRIKNVSATEATVEPGVFYRNFEKETVRHNAFLPSYPASREICTLGGMIANNAGGEKTLAYGKTDEYIKEIKIVLADGNEYAVKPLAKSELEQSIRKHTFEGKLYREIYNLLDTNHDIIARAKPNVSKNSAGYALWNIWDGKTFDLTKLFVGSQGTLGIITEATVRLVSPQKHRTLLVIFVKNLKNLGELINVVLKEKPESFESFDDHSLKLALRYIWEIIALISPKNIFSLAWQFLPEAWMVVTGGAPKLILLAEFTSHSAKETTAKARRAKAAVKKFGMKTRITTSEEEAKKYVVIRRESFNLLRHHLKNEQTIPCIDDMIVAPEQLPQFLPEVEAILQRYKLTYTIAGHIGDGNFHIIPLMRLEDPKTRVVIPKLMDEIYTLVLRYGGSITAEHNDGLLRGPYLKQMYGAEIYALFEKIKTICDPHGIFNPGKKVGGTMQYALDHLKTH